MTPYFSLILPCYNVEKYVARCVQSILKQDFADYEIILVDDGSTDGTPALCDALAAEHGCIRVIHKENGGAATARNTGLEAAQGRYVWFVDADDWISIDSLIVLYRAAEAVLPDVLKFNYYRVGAEKQENVSDIAAGLYEGIRLEQLQQMAYCEPRKFGMSGCMHVYSRDMLNRYSIHFLPEREIGCEDVLFSLQVLLHAKSLYMICHSLYNYVCREGSLSQTYSPDMINRYIALREYLTGYFYECRASQKSVALLNRFFVGRLVIGTCITQEYYTVPKWHDMLEARRAVKRLLHMSAVQRAAKSMDQSNMSWKKRVQVIALRLRIEPFFYWLYVTKPARKEWGH